MTKKTTRFRLLSLLAATVIITMSVAIEHDLGDWPGMFIGADGSLDATFVVGKDASTSDVLAAIRLGALLSQSAVSPVQLGGASKLKIRRTEVSGIKYGFGLAARGYTSAGNVRNDIAVGDLRKGFLMDVDAGGGLRSYHNMEFLEDRTVKTANEGDAFRVYDAIALDTNRLGLGNAAGGFYVENGEIKFKIPVNALRYRVYVEAPTDEDHDGDGSKPEGSTNIADYHSSEGLGTENYLPITLFGREYKLSAVSTDTPSITLLTGSLMVFQKGETVEYEGYRITLDELISSQGDNSAYFTVERPTGETNSFTPKYNDAKTDTGKFGNLVLTQDESDSFLSSSSAMLWVGIDYIQRTISATQNKKFVDSSHKETRWEFKSVVCEEYDSSLSGSMTKLIGTSLPTSPQSYYTSGTAVTGETHGYSLTEDGRTCVIEFSYAKDYTLTADGSPLYVPDNAFWVEYLGLNTEPVDELSVEWDNDLSLPYNAKGDTDDMVGFIIRPPKGAPLLLAGKQPVMDIRVGFPETGFSQSGVDCSGSDGVTGAKQYSTGLAEPSSTETTAMTKDTACMFIAYTSKEGDIKLYKTVGNFEGEKPYSTTSAIVASGVTVAEFDVLAKIYLDDAVYHIGLNTEGDGSDATSTRTGNLLIGHEEEGSVYFSYEVNFDWAKADDATEISGLLLGLEPVAGSATSTISTTSKAQISYGGIRVDNPDSEIDAGKLVFRVAKRIVRGMISINSGSTTFEETLVAGDHLGEWEVREVSSSSAVVEEYFQFSRISKPVGLLDSELGDVASAGNLIVMGGPVANRVSSMAGYTRSDFCMEGLKERPLVSCAKPMALIEIVDNILGGNNLALFIAGWDGVLTNAASHVLEHYREFADKLAGTRFEIVAESLPT